MPVERKLKICLAASAGGHLNQLLELAEAWKGREVFFVTTGAMVAAKLAERFGCKVFVVGESNRLHPLKAALVMHRCMKIIRSQRPDVVISTGAAHGCLLCIFAKLRGAKVVWIDSIANVERPSFSGRLARRFSDLFIVQWPDVAARCGAEYCGELI